MVIMVTRIRGGHRWALAQIFPNCADTVAAVVFVAAASFAATVKSTATTTANNEQKGDRCELQGADILRSGRKTAGIAMMMLLIGCQSLTSALKPSMSKLKSKGAGSLIFSFASFSIS